MVRIVDYRERQNAEGELFFALIIQGGIELVKSKESGLYYATAKKASIPSTFDEETCKSLVGQEIEGTVQKAPCEPYEVINQETGEIREMDYRWVYLKEGETVEDLVHVGRVAELV